MVSIMAPGTTGEDNLWTDIGESFLLTEDEALKTYLKGMTVSDEKNPQRSVGVWFGLPDQEVRDQSFPFLVIELVGVVEAKDREMRGLLKYLNDPGALAVYTDDSIRYAMTPLPFNLVYQVTAYCRHPRHNRQIISQMLSQKVPGRLYGLPVPTDGSKRSLELLAWTSRDTVESGRKLWQTIFTLSVTSEISDVNTDPLPVPPVEQAVVTVNITESEL